MTTEWWGRWDAYPNGFTSCLTVRAGGFRPLVSDKYDLLSLSVLTRFGVSLLQAVSPSQSFFSYATDFRPSDVSSPFGLLSL